MHPAVPVVFAGISLSHAAVRDIVTADTRPPIRAGDLDLLHGAGGTVLVIDGELGSEALVSAEEIERAIARGLDVWGASSVGALRAAGLRGRGMHGSGWVYRAFCSGRLAGTDEIAVLYDPRTFRPLTVPLVTVRYWLDHFVNQRVITALQAEEVMEAAKTLPVDRRTPRSVLRRIAATPIPEPMRRQMHELITPACDIKARDAHHLLHSLSAERTDPCRLPGSRARKAWAV